MLSLLLLVAAYLTFWAIRVVQTVRTKVPGPWYTTLTSGPLKYHEFSKNRRLWIHRLHQQYGLIVRLSPTEVAFSISRVSKRSIKVVAAVTTRPSSMTCSSSTMNGEISTETSTVRSVLMLQSRTMFSTLDRQDHAERKKTFAERYAMTNIIKSQVLDGIRERAAAVIAKCEESRARGYLDVYVTLHCYALDCASHFLLAPHGTYSLDREDDLKLMQELSYHDSIRSRLVHYYWPMSEKLIGVFGGKPASLSKQYVLKSVEDQELSPLDSSLLSKLKSKSSPLSDLKTAAECMDHMAAGIDTTGDALCFLMHELSLPRSQHIQRRLHDELYTHPDRNVNDLPYLDAVIKEGLRLFPPIPMSLPRYVPPGGRQISGYNLPGGSIVSCQAYSLHLLNEDVFPDPGTFLPERWLEKDGELERNRLFFAFASGGRGCIGKNLALVEMKTLLGEIYARFSTSVAPEMRDDMSIDDQIIASRPRDQTCLLSFYQIVEGV